MHEPGADRPCPGAPHNDSRASAHAETLNHEHGTHADAHRPTRRLVEPGAATRVGDQVSTWRTQCRPGRSTPKIPPMTCAGHTVAAAGSALLIADLLGHGPAEGTVVELDQPVTLSQTRQHLPLDDQGVWAGEVHQQRGRTVGLR